MDTRYLKQRPDGLWLVQVAVPVDPVPERWPYLSNRFAPCVAEVELGEMP